MGVGVEPAAACQGVPGGGVGAVEVPRAHQVPRGLHPHLLHHGPDRARAHVVGRGAHVPALLLPARAGLGRSGPAPADPILPVARCAHRAAHGAE